MSHLGKFGISLVLGCLAAALNWAWLSAEKSPPMFLATSVNVRAGEPLASEQLMAVPVPGDMARLRVSLIPYAKRALVLGMPATRDYVAGDMVFQRDVQKPIEAPSWDVLGPFQIISVGSRFKEQDGENQEYSSAGENVTIAVDKNFGEKTSRLLEALGAKILQRRPTNASELKIIAVQVVPNSRSETSSGIPSDDVVYQTVSLNGIPNVPRVLLEGEMIRFVVPKRVEY